MGSGTHISFQKLFSRRIGFCLVLLLACIGCSTASNETIPHRFLYTTAFDGSVFGEIAEYTPLHSFETLSEKLHIDPKSPSLLEDRGWLLARSGNYELAIADFKKAIRMMATSDTKHRSVVLCRLGITYFELGNLSKAIDAYSTAIEHDAQNWELYFHRSMALERAGRSDEANLDKATGLSLNPEEYPNHYSTKGGII